jgi:hypothetical protein
LHQDRQRPYDTFVKATGYVTVAERTPRAEHFFRARRPRIGRGLRGILAARSRRAARKPFPVAGVRAGCRMAPSCRTFEQSERTRTAARRAHRL